MDNVINFPGPVDEGEELPAPRCEDCDKPYICMANMVIACPRCLDPYPAMWVLKSASCKVTLEFDEEGER